MDDYRSLITDRVLWEIISTLVVWLYIHVRRTCEVNVRSHRNKPLGVASQYVPSHHIILYYCIMNALYIFIYKIVCVGEYANVQGIDTVGDFKVVDINKNK